MPAVLKVVNDRPVIRAGESTAEAARQARFAAADRALAEVSASTAEALVGPSYGTEQDGLDATDEGKTFAVNDGGIVTIYEKEGGVSVRPRVMITAPALASTDPDKGAALVGYDANSTAKDKLDRIIDVRDARFAGGADPSNANNTAAIQAALTYAGIVAPATVIADQGQYITDEVSVPTGVTFRCNLKLRVGATVGSEKNMVRVSSGCSVIGRLEGTNVTNVEVVERGIFPAGELAAHDVFLDIEVAKTTVGVQATTTDLNNPCRRWSGTIRCTDIAGLVPSPNGNGYGLNAAMCDSTLLMFCKNVPRHSLYLAAGASRNNIVLHCDGGRFAPVDIACSPAQPECFGNTILAFVTNHQGDYPGVKHTGGFFAGNCRGNKVEIHVSGSAPLDHAFFTQATIADVDGVPTIASPTDNELIVHFDGQLKGSDNAVVELNSSSGTKLSVFGAASGTTVATRSIVRVGVNDALIPPSPRAKACTIKAVDFAVGANIPHIVINAISYAVTDIGQGTINVTGATGLPVVLFTAAEFLGGWVYETDFVGTTGVIAAGATGGLAVTFNDPLPTRRYITYSVAPLSDPGANAPNHYIQPILDGSCTIKVKNNDTGDQNFIVSGRAYGF